MTSTSALEATVEARPALPRTSTAQILINGAVVFLPFVGLLIGLVLSWGWGFGWLDLALLVGMYFVTSVGITVGFHRLFTHRSFETYPFVRFILAALGSMTAQGSLFDWVALHRRHHQHSDRPGDPHSPHLHGRGIWGVLRGFLHAHVGWMFLHMQKDLPRYAADLAKSRSLRLASALFPLWVTLGLLIPTVLGGLITGTWLGAFFGLVWGGLVRMCLFHHVTWSINSVCHLWGSRPHDGNDLSTNNAMFGILALGEGWHNNHHAYPTSARHGLRWWQIDISYIVIRSLALIGLAWKIKLPEAENIPADAAA